MRVAKSADLLLPARARRAPSRRPAADGSGELQALWDVVATIPRGMVATYGTVARAAGLPGRARLAGFALKVAPDDLNLPWYRVLGAGGRIVFPKGSARHREQARRLRAERVPVDNGRVNRSYLTDLGTS